MANIQNIHQKKFDEIVTEANSRIDELLKIIKNKNKIVDFLKIRLIDKSQTSMKSKKNKQSIELNTKNDVFHINMKKNVKMIIFSDPNKFTEKNELCIDD